MIVFSKNFQLNIIKISAILHNYENFFSNKKIGGIFDIPPITIILRYIFILSAVLHYQLLEQMHSHSNALFVRVSD